MSGRKKRTGGAGFSLIEVIFAIAMLGIGVVSILALFTTGIARATWAGNTTEASMEAQSLLTRILSQVDSSKPPKRIFLEKIQPSTGTGTGQEWIHGKFNTDGTVQFKGNSEPVQIDDTRDYFWVCRAKKARGDVDSSGVAITKAWKPPLDPDDPLDLVAGKSAYTDNANAVYVNGLYEIAIGIWKNYEPSKKDKKPVVVYTTFVTAGY